MANLDNFTTDEQLLINLSISIDGYVNKIIELTGMSRRDILISAGYSCGEFIASLSEDDVRDVLDTAGKEAAIRDLKSQQN